MIIGKIRNNEKRIRFNLDIKCSNCKTQVPGGVQAAERYYGSKSFYKEIEKFKKNYLCGRCRDIKRINSKKSNIN